MRKILTILLVITSVPAISQTFDRQDSLRGMITPEREWWDLTFYHLDVKVDPEDSTISGDVTVNYTVLKSASRMQIDLQNPLKISGVKDMKGNQLDVVDEGNAHFITLTEPQVVGDKNSIVITYGGKPKVAVNPPWDGGISWERDAGGKPIVHSNCQGIGASIWWPCKDHMYDEPDSVLISVNVPKGVMDVSNGRLRGVDTEKDGTRTFHWFVSNPISNYVISINIADYAHFSEKYQGENGELDMDYYVFPQNLGKAREQFKDAPRMMEAFEHWFGPYPFYEDSYKLIDVTSTGMEHQSAVTYGNGYANGYRGRDGSGTGWGFKFDFIIIHESGHEWFANNITYKDVADMWIHESFTNYSESLFLDYHFGKKAGEEYVIGTRKLIRNDRPIIGTYNVNHSGSGDMYVKGGNMLNTLRQVINDDAQWRKILRGLNSTFYHQTVTTAQIEGYIAREAGMDLTSFFNQYLRDTRIPVLEYYFKEGQLFYRWNNVVQDFNMPVDVVAGGKQLRLEPTNVWQNAESGGADDLVLNRNFYAAKLAVMGE